MIDALTWKRAGLLFMFGTFVVLLLMLFENRTTIFNRLVDPIPVENLAIPWQVTDKTKEELTNLVSIPQVGGVLLTEVDLKKNRRITKFWSAKDASFRQEVGQIIGTLLPQAFFDTDPRNNEQMLAVLNNQFVCSPTEETVFVRFFPNLQKRYPVTCRLAVPPFSGHFAGMVTVLLNKVPTQGEVDSLKIEITRVSVEMYLRDVQSRERKKQ